MEMKVLRGSAGLALMAYLLLIPSLLGASARPNVLFIAVDDLRPELGCYGKAHIHSPHIDQLALTGALFERAYCMVPTCGASRAALMTGIRPAHNRFVNYLTWAERDAPGALTLNAHFRHHGYRTISLGKVFHHRMDSRDGWSEVPWRPSGRGHYALPENQRMHRQNSRKEQKPTRGPAVESADVSDDFYRDGQIANEAVRRLEEFAEEETPFFLAVGFMKPHLPFVAPKRYWDLYPATEVTLPPNYHPPQEAPEGAVHAFGELRAYQGIPPTGILSEDQARELIRGYYACVSYTDAQIGRVLEALAALGLSENTIVVLWGDHGWNLGEHTMWCKHSTFETSLHSPLILRAPGLPRAQRSGALIEFIDIYPTLCDLAGLPQPDHLEGRSFVPLLREPNLAWKPFAVSRYRNGDSIRTDRYRFTQYWTRDHKPQEQMLYDHALDPGENTNLTPRKAFRAITDRLEEQLLFEMGLPTP